MKDIITLSIESSCDETAVAILKNGREVLANIVSTQIELHKKFGGVVPEVASRKHIENIDAVYQEALDTAGIKPEEIDHINILKASFLAMHRAIKGLKIEPQHLLIDGNRFTPYPGIPHTCIVKGDGKMMSIAAASILAKTHRDEYMCAIDKEFPQYGWSRNKGYPTKDHRAAIEQYGATVYHRKTFRLLDPQLPFE